MNKIITVLIIGTFLLVVGCKSTEVNRAGEHASQGESAFMNEVKTKAVVYSQVDNTKQEKLFLDGNSSSAIDELKKQNKNHTAADYFILGNMLYRTDIEASFNYHKMAYREYPNEPSVQLEMAMQYHREGDCKTALPFYEKIISSGSLSSKPKFVLVAHCYLKAGKYEKAVEYWQMSDFANYHVSIDKTIHDVFGKTHPMSRYSKLAQRIKQGDESAIGSILELSERWDLDWWNISFNEKAYSNALSLIYETWPAESKVGQELLHYELMNSASDLSEFKEYCDKFGYFSTASSLPKNPYLMKKLVTSALELKYITPEQLLDKHFDYIKNNLAPDEQAIYQLEVLAHILVSTKNNDKLPEIDEIGWKKYKKVKFAKSFYIGHLIKNENKIQFNDPVLEAMINDFPKEPYFRVQQYAIALKANKQTKKQLVALIDAEYYGLLSNRNQFARSLNSFYHRLATQY
ncbi:tetratricopeptide repeat protein [Aliikangiella coralliicola]|uniref:Tetratricopeptide repeat protein n=1 Tax=Aliikangiella coralliicola TaxID=2592383 RepID=A0A545UDJ4_9GAMM|nr:hypothetical protein [Aliikangiella coralliicola]TQV87503.1 hypothetical protein FLL46_11550 [Aliikangiella coralliicola]